jgi:hypothetical protein
MKYHDRKTYGDVERELQVFLNSTPDGNRY